MGHHFENQSLKEELANSITHGLGAALAITATVLLTLAASQDGSIAKVVSFAIFGAALIILYTVSTLYHGLSLPKAKRVFHIFDHSAIFLLIAGTYTPITLVALGGGWGWALFGVIWGLAISGIVLTSIWFDKTRYITLGIYISMGWLAVIAAHRIVTDLSAPALLFLVIGGLFYTGGTYFYRAKQKRFNHMIWHIFVLMGSASHVLCMFQL